MKIKLALLFLFALNSSALATDLDYSKAAGHTGIYVNLKNVRSLKCRIKTYDLTAKNNKLGWYTAWPMIVDYKTGKFVQIGYITSPMQKILKPTFYVAWSDDGKQINVKYLPDNKSSGNALTPTLWHEYALSLNTDGSANIQIDGIKYLEDLDERVNTGISSGTGEFFAEGSNLDIDISTEFSHCAFKLVGDTEWKDIDQNKDILLYYVSKGTSIERKEENNFFIKGKVRAVSKGDFFAKIPKINH